MSDEKSHLGSRPIPPHLALLNQVVPSGFLSRLTRNAATSRVARRSTIPTWWPAGKRAEPTASEGPPCLSCDRRRVQVRWYIRTPPSRRL